MENTGTTDFLNSIDFDKVKNTLKIDGKLYNVDDFNLRQILYDKYCGKRNINIYTDLLSYYKEVYTAVAFKDNYWKNINQNYLKRGFSENHNNYSGETQIIEKSNSIISFDSDWVYINGINSPDIREDELFRFYFNVKYTEKGSSFETIINKLFKIFFNELNQRYVSFKVKLPQNSINFGRRDNTVLYVDKSNFWLVLQVINNHYESIKDYLEIDVPLFTYKFANGIAIAEEPRNNFSTSFGEYAIDLLLEYFKKNKKKPSKFDKYLAKKSIFKSYFIDNIVVENSHNFELFNFREYQTKALNNICFSLVCSAFELNGKYNWLRVFDYNSTKSLKKQFLNESLATGSDGIKFILKRALDYIQDFSLTEIIGNYEFENYFCEYGNEVKYFNIEQKLINNKPIDEPEKSEYCNYLKTLEFNDLKNIPAAFLSLLKIWDYSVDKICKEAIQHIETLINQYLSECFYLLNDKSKQTNMQYNGGRILFIYMAANGGMNKNFIEDEYKQFQFTQIVKEFVKNICIKFYNKSIFPKLNENDAYVNPDLATGLCGHAYLILLTMNAPNYNIYLPSCAFYEPKSKISETPVEMPTNFLELFTVAPKNTE